jgi:hypothetical protein
MVAQDWETVFNADQPQTLYARNNMAAASLMGTTADYFELGHSAEGFFGAPAFSDGTTYTLDLYVARMSAAQCSVSLNLTGGGTNYSTTLPDTTYGYHRFDCLAIRPASQQATAIEFDISEFKVQVLQMPPPPTLNIARSGTNLVLSWTNPATYAPFRLTQAAAVTGTYNAVAGAANPYTVSPTNAARFFRLAWP